MKANEFVKSFGWDAVKHKADELKIIESMGDKLSFEDENLKRLVESRELVEKLGGIDTMRIMQKQMVLNSLKGGMNISFDGEFVGTFSFNQLEQAIADVESCVGVG